MTRFFIHTASHLFDSNRWSYLARCFAGYARRERWKCPNCGSPKSNVLEHKNVVTSLLRCGECELLFRAPTDPPDFGKRFYQQAYQQGFTTDCPSDPQLAAMLKAGFQGTPKDFSQKIELLRAIGLESGARILDFGASWGYGCWQFQQAGFSVIGYEPSSPRAQYARQKLNVEVTDDEQQIEKTVQSQRFDAIFSSHVLEHVPKPSEVIAKCMRWLKPGGYFVAYTPNGSLEYRKSNPQGYHNHWGMVHPNYLNPAFYLRELGRHPSYITGTPVDLERVRAWNRSVLVTDRLESWELLVIARRVE